MANTVIGNAVGVNYMKPMVGADQLLQGTPNYDVEVSEGINPPGAFYTAHYLPTTLPENRIGGSYFTLTSGKVISFDKNKRLVGAGLAQNYIDWCDAYVTAYDAATTGKDAAGLTAAEALTSNIKYTAQDVTARFTNAAGGVLSAGDTVASGMFTAATAMGYAYNAAYKFVTAASATAAQPIGIMRYSALMSPGTNPSDPSTFWRHAYDTGGARAFSRWAYIQVPVVETLPRTESFAVGATDVRIALWPDMTPGGFSGFDQQNAKTAFVFKLANGTTKVLTQKVSPQQFTATQAGAGIPDQFAVLGRTIFVNEAVGTGGLTITYQPRVDLPFTCLKTEGAATGQTAITAANNFGVKDYLGEKVTFDYNSDFVLGSSNKIGQVLDVKLGSDKDLALVRTYFRDAGLWQEGPGSATDGRNAMLSIVNAPKYIACIAVNFNTF